MDFYDDDEYDNYEDDDDEVLPPPGESPESPERVHDFKLGNHSFVYYFINCILIVFILDPTGTTPPTHNRFLSSTPTRPIPGSSPLSRSSLPPSSSNPTSPSAPSPSSAPSTPSQPAVSFSNYKLAFYVHDQRLTATTTIFQAVQKLTRGNHTVIFFFFCLKTILITYLDLTNPDTPQPVHRMWETVHTLKYRLIPIDSTEGFGMFLIIYFYFIYSDSC